MLNLLSHPGTPGQGPSEPQATFERPLTKTLGPMLPLASTLTSARHSPHRTASLLGLPASFELTLTLGQPLRDPSQVPGAATPGIGDPRAPAPDSPCRSATTVAARGAAGHSGRENGQGPRAPGNLQRSPAPKRLGPRSRSSAPSPRPPLRSPHIRRIGPAINLGANPKPYVRPEGPSQEAWCRHTRAWGPPSTSARLTLSPARGVFLIQGGRTGSAL